MKNIFAYTLLLLLTSCSAKYLTIVDQVLPAERPLPEEVRSVVLLDRAKESNLGTRLSSGQLYNPGNVQLLRNCSSKLPIYATVHPKSVRGSNAGAPAIQMSREEVRGFVAQADAIFSLDQMFFSEERHAIEYDKHQLDADGNDYYIKAVRATKVSRMSALWRLYDGRSGSVLMELPYEIEDAFEAEALNHTSVNAKLDTLHVVNPDRMAREIVDMMIADVTPTPITSNWLYYAKGNNLLERSANYLREGNYRSAVRIIEKSERAIPQMKKPDRVQHNWATALFLSGDAIEAERIAREGYDRYGKSDLLTLAKKIAAAR